MAAISCNYRAGCGSALKQVRDRRKSCKRRKLTKTFAVSRSLCFPRRRAHLLVLHWLPARLGWVDLDSGGRAVDGLHMSESWVLNGEEEGGALQRGGDWTTRITLFRQCKNSMNYMVLINKRQTREESATQSMELWTVRHYIETEFCQRSENL